MAARAERRTTFALGLADLAEGRATFAEGFVDLAEGRATFAIPWTALAVPSANLVAEEIDIVRTISDPAMAHPAFSEPLYP
jgi:hypothetical protein